jgi:hypothetical protein
LTDSGVFFADFSVWEYTLADNVNMAITSTNAIL